VRATPIVTFVPIVVCRAHVRPHVAAQAARNWNRKKSTHVNQGKLNTFSSTLAEAQ
jgi:hypothetical protein